MKKTKQFSSYATKRTYFIKRNSVYKCDSTWCIYYIRCSEHPEAGYVGQTYSEATANSKGGLYKWHCGHRADCKSGTGGLGSHYFTHHGGSTETMDIVVIDSVEPGDHEGLDRKEEYWIYQLKTLDTMGHGGLNNRDELVRKQRDKARLYCSCISCRSKNVRGVKRKTATD